ncbi:MAG: carboxylesterase family protein [Caulobacteraceae bacterium]|nr:carboxylesterase family protein [Caulobacteraceae bacterium]
MAAQPFVRSLPGRLCVALALSLGVGLAARAGPLVQLDAGRIEGAEEGGAAVFRGVPFAAPPVGPLRWRPPQPTAGWSGTREAVAYGPDCLQPPMSAIPGPGFTNPQSEDCLYLNVWAPKARPAAPMPVMVWIYGGAFIMGSGSYPDYDGAHFAEQGVVLVTINYRVGLFGFFAHPALTREAAGAPVGDYGFMDQVAALKWVQRNIAAFGGDPSNVTIFGESAGGFAVNAMLASPAARGLFAKAISESGGGRSISGGLGWPTLQTAEARGKAWAASAGVSADDPAALRAIPADVVLKASSGPALPGPMVDGQIVPEPIETALRDGHHAVVPYLVGANSYEESLLQWLPRALAEHERGLGGRRDEAMRLYGEDGKVDPDTAARRLWGDDFMVAPARFLARGMSASGAPTYLYHYAYAPKAMRGKVPGAPHSAEINLVFANQDRVSMFGEGPDDAAMADLMHAYWIAFARTGDPNGQGRPVWPAYSASGDVLMDFTNEGPVAVKGFEKARLDLLDRIYEAGR